MKLKPYGEGGEQGGLAMEENKDGDGSGMADRAEGRTADLGAAVAASSCTGERESGAGETAGRAATGSTPL